MESVYLPCRQALLGRENSGRGGFILGYSKQVQRVVEPMTEASPPLEKLWFSYDLSDDETLEIARRALVE